MPLHLPASPARPLIRKLIAAGLDAADPADAVFKTVSFEESSLRVGRRTYNLSRFQRVIAIGAGKASGKMAQAIEQILGPRLDGGFVVVTAGHKTPTKKITVVEAGHPIPDRNGLRAATRMRAWIRTLTPRDLVLVLLSGGASSLLPAPVPGVTLAAKQRTTRLLLRSGASIGEINTVRKHLSTLKGGGLVLATKAAVATLILSDVLGDDIGTIGSGPTAADPTTFADALGILRRYKMWQQVPIAVRRHLLHGKQGIVHETLKPRSWQLRRVHHTIIANNRVMLDAVVRAAEKAGLRTCLLSDPVTGEARLAAEHFVRIVRNLIEKTGRLRRPCCVIAGGEPTVTVTSRGKGGRAQEFAAAAALGLDGVPNVWLTAMGSDGTDGPTDAAGAIISGKTAEDARKAGMSLRAALDRHNTYPTLQKLGCQIRTGPTGTNVNDLYLLLLL